MPFQSEKQRRYLWANEPEIARDWTDTYGSRIHRDNGGITNPRLLPHQPRDLLVQNNPYGTRPRYQPPGQESREPEGRSPSEGGQFGDSYGPGRDYGGATHHHSVDTPTQIQNQKIANDLNRQNQMSDLIDRHQQEKDYRDTRYVGTDFGNYTLGGQEKVNEYNPTFSQKFKMGMGNLFSGLGGGIRNLAGIFNPAAWATDNPFLRAGLNYSSKNLFNKRNQNNQWIDPDEKDDIAWENINYNPNALTRSQMEKGIMTPDILPEPKYDNMFDDTYLADASTNEELLEKILNPDLGVDEFMDKKEQREKIQQELLKKMIG